MTRGYIILNVYLKYGYLRAMEGFLSHITYEYVWLNMEHEKYLTELEPSLQRTAAYTINYFRYRITKEHDAKVYN